MVICCLQGRVTLHQRSLSIHQAVPKCLKSGAKVSSAVPGILILKGNGSPSSLPRLLPFSNKMR